LSEFLGDTLGHYGGVTSLPAEQLLRLPVRLNSVAVGRAVDLLVDPGQGRALGLDVLCGDDTHRFLPLAAAEVVDGEIRLSSPFALLDEAGFDFYRGRTSSLRALKGKDVQRSGRRLGALRDVVVTAEGEIEALVVEVEGEAPSLVPVAPEISFDGNGPNGGG
jgi:hypothetical protein